MKQPTPMIRQYHEIKARVKDCLLFFRLGDFYELFFEDAKIASAVCDLTLTARHKHQPDPVPMCGVPYHAAAAYVEKLQSAGHKIAICEQTEDVAAAKGLVKRDVVRVITPGMPFDSLEIDSGQSHYLAALAPCGTGWGIAFVDVTSGEFWYSVADALTPARALIFSSGVKELLVSSERAPELDAWAAALEAQSVRVQWCDGSFFSVAEARSRLEAQFQARDLDAFFRPAHRDAMGVCGAALKYIQLCEPTRRFPHLQSCRYHSLRHRMLLTSAEVASLELVSAPSARDASCGLLQTIDGSMTPMGRRLARTRVLAPLVDMTEIARRLDAQTAFVDAYERARPMIGRLAGVGDIARLYSKAAQGYASPREVWRLGHGLATAEEVTRALAEIDGLAPYVCPSDAARSLARDVLATLTDDPPANAKDGGYIREGVDPELGEAIHAADHFEAWRREYESTLQATLSIPSLKIKYNRVFGHSIEVTKTHLSKVPDYFIRRQTVATGERFVTEELKQKEAAMLRARERQTEIERRLFEALTARLVEHKNDVETFVAGLAEIDMVSGLCAIICRQGWTRPQLDTSSDIVIEDGFHPVVSDVLRKDGKVYARNSILMYGQKSPLWLISGPNMGGKSTLMRQIALTVVLAQMGCYVPARVARIGLVDQIFTRIGAADAQTEGKSTFYMEMQDTARFLSQATPRSLILIDELGRGTSTYDGLSILWAVCEYLVRTIRPRAFCATHFYELAALKEKYPEIGLWHLGAQEMGGQIIFDYKLNVGFTEKSYGIHVAQLAGVIPDVVNMARRALKKFEARDRAPQQHLPI